MDLFLDLVWLFIFVRVGGRVVFKCIFIFYEKRFGKEYYKENRRRDFSRKFLEVKKYIDNFIDLRS